jgi:hypothetical protein
LAASEQPQRLGQVAGVGASEQLDQAEPGVLLLHRGGGQARAAGEDAALAAPGGDIEPGLGQAA